MENQKPFFSAAEPSVRSAAGKSPEANSARSVAGSPPSHQSSSVPKDVRSAVMEYADRAQLEQYFRIARVLSEHPDEVNAVLGEGHGLSMLEVAQSMYERAVIENRQPGVSSSNSYGETMNLVKSARQGRRKNPSVTAAGSGNTHKVESDDLPGGHNGE